MSKIFVQSLFIFFCLSANLNASVKIKLFNKTISVKKGFIEKCELYNGINRFEKKGGKKEIDKWWDVTELLCAVLPNKTDKYLLEVFKNFINYKSQKTFSKMRNSDLYDIVLIADMFCHKGALRTCGIQLLENIIPKKVTSFGQSKLLGEHSSKINGIKFLKKSRKQDFVTYDIGGNIFYWMFNNKAKTFDCLKCQSHKDPIENVYFLGGKNIEFISHDSSGKVVHWVEKDKKEFKDSVLGSLGSSLLEAVTIIPKSSKETFVIVDEQGTVTLIRNNRKLRIVEWPNLYKEDKKEDKSAMNIIPNTKNRERIVYGKGWGKSVIYHRFGVVDLTDLQILFLCKGLRSEKDVLMINKQDIDFNVFESLPRLFKEYLTKKKKITIIGVSKRKKPRKTKNIKLPNIHSKKK